MNTDALAWVVVGLFCAAAVAGAFDRRRGRLLAAAAWVSFAAFWAVLFPYFAFEMRSFVEGGLVLVGVPACLYVAYRLATGAAPATLDVVTRAVAVMGVVYLPFQTLPAFREALVELVAGQVYWVVTLLGYDPVFAVRPGTGHLSEFTFTTGGHEYTTFIVLACTGIGSMAIFGGLIAAVEAPLRRKLRALAVAIPVIYVLNIARNVFIAVAFGKQWFDAPWLAEPLGYSQPGMVSFFVADRVISQVLSVVALVGIAWLAARQLPELLVVAEDLVALSGRDVDLGATRTRADGGDRDQ